MQDPHGDHSPNRAHGSKPSQSFVSFIGYYGVKIGSRMIVVNKNLGQIGQKLHLNPIADWRMVPDPF